MNSRSDTKSTNSTSAARRLTYSLAAGAAASGAANALAAINYGGPEGGNPISVNQENSQSLKINLGDSFNDIVLKNYIFLGGNYQGATVNFAPGRLVGFKVGNLAYATALSAGALIDANSTMPDFKGSLAYGAINPNAQFNSVTDAYIGFSFPVSGSLYYAWVRVDVDNVAGSLIIHDWAWESELGKGIRAGDKGAATPAPGDFDLDGDVDGADFLTWQQKLGNPLTPGDLENWISNYAPTGATTASAPVPEPGTLGLLAAGAGGLGWLRRRRRRD